jgi:hypothetical protein
MAKTYSVCSTTGANPVLKYLPLSNASFLPGWRTACPPIASTPDAFRDMCASLRWRLRGTLRQNWGALRRVPALGFTRRCLR